jgi:hypothetical protein
LRHGVLILAAQPVRCLAPAGSVAGRQSADHVMGEILNRTGQRASKSRSGTAEANHCRGCRAVVSSWDPGCQRHRQVCRV